MAFSSLNSTYQENSIQSDSQLWWANLTYFYLFISASICFVLQYTVQRTKSALSMRNEHFCSFQKKYFMVYFLALFGDWLQGPYLYKLYSHYGFANFQIAVLYVVGFSASLFFGTGAGVLADYFGRKKMCMAFCFIYSLCCLTKMFPNYNLLLLGRLLGGISTSLLFSVFESWYIYTHIQSYDFPKEWISVTFSQATFWNGILAMIAGIVANFSSETLNLGPVSPFLLAIPCFLVSCCVISVYWGENYGTRHINSLHLCFEGLKVIFSHKLILMLGIVQSLFESVMYVFVFLWTPVLDVKHLPLGIVFSTFMICIMIGSSVYQLLLNKFQPQYMLLLAVTMATVSQCGCFLATMYSETNVLLSYGSFILLEVAVGIYFPAIGYIKSECIPESHRATIMSWLRVPLNVITCIALLSLHGETYTNGNCIIFVICAGMMLVSFFIMIKTIKILPHINMTLEQIC